jgi:pimeloyl-ACP methyl ester carboxylesterase/ketosteroid isomerase-like protein
MLFRRWVTNLMVVSVMFFSTEFVTGDEGTARVVNGYAPVNGLKLYYEVHVNADDAKPPLVLLHGGGSTIETTFGKILPLLSMSRQVIAFDQQGHGRTADITDRPFSFEQSADDTAALLEHLKIERSDLFGFSNGGNIALQVAIRHPKRVRKLIVASAGIKRGGHPQEFWEFMKHAKLETMPKVLRDEYVKLSPHPEQLSTFFGKSVQRMREFKDFSVEDIQSIRAPTLVMIGDSDNIRPEHAVELFRLLPHGRLAIMPGGHGEAIGEVTAARFDGSQVQFGNARRSSKVPELVVAMLEEFLDAPMPQPKTPSPTKLPQKPEDWPGLFEQHLNAGDLDAVMMLYEPEARLVARSGEIQVGHDRIRETLAGMISKRMNLHSQVIKTVVIDDIAQLYTDFEGTAVDESGATVEARYKAVEVLRRQPDGTWKLIMGDPNGRR